MTERTGRALVWAIMLLTLTYDIETPGPDRTGEPWFIAAGDLAVWFIFYAAVITNMFDFGARRTEK